MVNPFAKQEDEKRHLRRMKSLDKFYQELLADPERKKEFMKKIRGRRIDRV